MTLFRWNFCFKNFMLVLRYKRPRNTMFYLCKFPFLQLHVRRDILTNKVKVQFSKYSLNTSFVWKYCYLSKPNNLNEMLFWGFSAVICWAVKISHRALQIRYVVRRGKLICSGYQPGTQASLGVCCGYVKIRSFINRKKEEWKIT